MPFVLINQTINKRVIDPAERIFGQKRPESTKLVEITYFSKYTVIDKVISIDFL